MNTRFTVFVPEYVDLTGFDKAAWSSRYDFVDVDSTSFDPEVELTRLTRFIIFQSDHIVCYNKNSAVYPLKMRFIPGRPVLGEARERLCLAYIHFSNSGFFDNRVQEPCKGPAPLLCFVEKDKYNAGGQPKDEIFESFALEPYSRDSQGNIDIGNLANMAKERDGYEYDVFVVKNGDKYRAHSLDETISHTLIEVSKMATMLRVGSCTIHDLARIDGYLPLKQQLRDFKLCDRTGTPVEEGEEFWLQIADWHISDFEEDYDTEATSFEDKYCNIDCIHAYGVVCGVVGYPTMLTHEVVDGITYLKAGGKYFYISDSKEIDLSDSIPQKEKRVQIEYDHRGDIMLYSWGGAMFSSCEWVKSTCGVISVGEVGTSAEELWPMVLRLHRR